MSLSDKLSELDNIIAKLRYVKRGDWVLSSDHNDLVDAVKKIREALGLITGAEEPNYSKYDRIALKTIEVSTDISVSRARSVRGFISNNEALVCHIELEDTDGNTWHKVIILSIPDLNVVASYPEYKFAIPYPEPYPYISHLGIVCTCSELARKYYLVNADPGDYRVFDVYRGKTKITTIDATDVVTELRDSLADSAYACVSHDGRYIAVLGARRVYAGEKAFKLSIALYEGRT